ncbi:MAG: outer membrane protein assembly factor BamA [Deltaproteobacteria bacterium]
MRGTAAVLALGVLLALGRAPARAAGFPVTAIDVQGANRVGADAIRRAMGTRVGADFDPERIREDVKAIFRMGYFSDVRFDAEEAGGGYRLTVIVTEKPIVSAVAIEGNKDVETADLRQALTLKERSLFQEDKVKESARKLLEVCQNKGFYDAVVDSAVSEDPDGSYRIVFKVKEGEKLKIDRIAVTGNHYLEAKAIRKAMDTGTKGFFSFITDSGTFKKDVLENDVRKIEAMYQNNGFLDSKVSDPEIGRGKKGLEITVHVFEGKQYRVGKVGFSGESDVSADDLRKAVKLKQADVFSRETLLADLLALTTILNDRGYAQAIVSPVVEKRKDYPLADVTYRTEQGRKFRFGKVDVTGNTKTYDRVVRRGLSVADGKTYTATGLKRSKENLTRLGYFKDVKISTAPSATVQDEMDVKVDVQEAPTGTLSGGLGFSSVDKLFGVVQLNENNLFGRGWRATLNTQFGARRTVYTLEFRDAHFLDTNFNLLLNAYKTETKYTDFERKGKGGRVGTGYNLDRFTSVGLTYRYDDVLVTQLAAVTSTFLKEQFALGWQQTQSLTLNLTRNSTDRFIDPSRGSVASGSVEYAGSPLGGDSRFVKYFLNGKVYFPVTESTVLSANALWGHVVSTVNGEVPLAERFFLGGPYSVRGFRSRSLSPADPNTGELIGGNKELVLNAEYIFPLFNEIGFKGVLFYDMGNSWRQGEWPWKGPSLRTAAGLGIRWYSPMGPLRFEWGWNLRPQAGEARRVAEFTIGTAF